MKRNALSYKLIVRNCDKLTALKYLPDILTFIRIVREKFHCRFTRKETNSISVKDFIKLHSAELNISQRKLCDMIQSYVCAWNLVITCNDFVVDADAKQLPEDPPLSEFLIDKHARHYSHPRQLIEFLVLAHNTMITDDRPAAPISEVTSSLLVSISVRDEIYSLLSSHSMYEVDTETRLNYDLKAVEREISLRFVGTKAKILPNQSDYGSLFYMFKEDFNLQKQFEVLKGTQERLDKEAQNSISCHASRTIQVLTSNLKELNIVINYLSVMPQFDLEGSLQKFMESIGTAPTYLSDDVKLKHVRHVWILIKYAQTDSLMHNDQQPFDDIAANYTHDLSEDMQALVDDCCTYNSPRTKSLLQELFEYIIFRLNKQTIAVDIEDPEERLSTALTTSVMKQNPTDLNRCEKIMEDLPTLRDKLMVKHAAKVWCVVWKRYNTRVAF